MRMLIPFCLLIAGIIMEHTGTQWFDNGTIRAIWYAAAWLPVGLPVIKEAWEAIRKKDIFNEFSLMTIASIGAFCIGEYPESVAVMLFWSIGESLQDKAIDKATRNINGLLDVRPEHARVLRGERYEEVSPKEVNPGEEIEIRPGERVPLDGIMTDEDAMFDTSALTGESIPRIIKKGEEVLAGMISSDRTVHLKVTRPYDNSELARILALVRDATERKAPTEQFIRKFARIYTPAVILLSALIIAVPAIIGLMSDNFGYIFSEWLYRGLVFLVISCPCALVISVPLGYFAGIGAASRKGILFKGGNWLDAIAKVTDVAFDKTGTLTTGQFSVNGTVCADGISENELVAMLASVESKSTHPIAKAITEYAHEHKIPLYEPKHIREIPGHGTEAEIDGKIIAAGNARLMEKYGVKIPDNAENAFGTTVHCLIGGKYAGTLLLSDTLKDDAGEAVNRLKEAGIKHICILSGDRKEIARAYADKLGIDEAYGELLPEDKAAYVEKTAKTPGRSIAFVGDGMNDAPVLALSDVGIAMGGLGSDAAIESADVVIQTDQPSKVATAVKIGRATRRIVFQNIIGSIAVKVAILVAGAFGAASMWMAVFADVGVALLAVLNSMRIFRQ